MSKARYVDSVMDARLKNDLNSIFAWLAYWLMTGSLQDHRFGCYHYYYYCSWLERLLLTCVRAFPIEIA